MTGLELFAGGGGAALGLRAAGLEVLAHVEWDADACETLRQAGLLPVVEADVREVDWSPYVGAGLIWASPPCQGFSAAGKRLGKRDPRNGWPWLLCALDAVRPRWLIAENVPGLIQHSRDCAEPCAGCYWLRELLPAFAARFASVQAGVLNAADYGVPQHRRRVFLVAGPTRIRWPAPTHGPPGQLGLYGELAPWVTIREALGLDVVDDDQRGTRPGNTSARTVGCRGNAMVLDHGRRGSVSPVDAPSCTVRDGNGAGPVLRAISGGHNPAHRGDWRGERDITGEPSTTIAAGHSNQRPALIAIHQPARSLDPGRQATTLDCGRTGDSYRSPSLTVTATEGRGCATDARRASRCVRRRLTVEECAILQGFPATHRCVGSKASRYAQIGNAVPPVMAELLARQVIALDTGTGPRDSARTRAAGTHTAPAAQHSDTRSHRAD